MDVIGTLPTDIASLATYELLPSPMDHIQDRIAQGMMQHHLTANALPKQRKYLGNEGYRTTVIWVLSVKMGRLSKVGRYPARPVKCMHDIKASRCGTSK
jgi:hypothetical protein